MDARYGTSRVTNPQPGSPDEIGGLDPSRRVVRTVLMKAITIIVVFSLLEAAIQILSQTVLRGIEDPDDVLYTIRDFLWVGCIYGITRWFRGDNESSGPRPWWRMSAYPTASFLMSLAFLLPVAQEIYLLSVGFAEMPAWTITPYLAIGILYQISAIRLGAYRFGGAHEKLDGFR